MKRSKTPCYGYRLDNLDHPAAREHFTKFLNDECNDQVHAEDVEVILPFGSVLISRRFMFEWSGTVENPTARVQDVFDVQVFGKDRKEMSYRPGCDNTYDVEYMNDDYTRLSKSTYVHVTKQYPEEVDV